MTGVTDTISMPGGCPRHDQRGLIVALKWLLAVPFKDRRARVVVRDAAGAAKAETVQTLAAASGTVGDGAKR